MNDNIGSLGEDSDLIELPEGDKTYIRFDNLPLVIDAENPPSIDGDLTQPTSIRAISIRLISSSRSSSTPSPTGTEELVSVTIKFFTWTSTDPVFQPLSLDGKREAKVRMRNILTKTYYRPLFSESSNKTL